MRTIDVDGLPEPVARAMEVVVETLRAELRLEGREAVDPEKVKAAIIARRDASRTLNEDWEHVDREAWATASHTAR